MSGPLKTPTHRTGTGIKLDDVLRGEALSSFPSSAQPLAIDEMIHHASRRFGPNGLWTIGVPDSVEPIAPQARLHLRKGFEHFRQAGGIKVVVICAKPLVATAFIRAASEAGVELAVAKTMEEQARLSNDFRARYHPKPKPVPPK